MKRKLYNYLYILANILILFLGFFPYAEVNGVPCSPVTLLLPQMRNGLGGEEGVNAFVIWAVFVLLTYIPNVILVVRILLRKRVGRMEDIAAYMTYAGVFFNYCALSALSKVYSYDYQWNFWIILRAVLVLVFFILQRYYESKDNGDFDEIIAKRRPRGVRRPSFLFHILNAVVVFLLALFAPWYEENGDYRLLPLTVKIIRESGPRAFGGFGEGSVDVAGTTRVLGYMIAYLMAAAVLFLLIGMLLAIFRKADGWARVIAYALTFTFTCAYTIFQPLPYRYGMPIALVLIGVDAVIGTLIDQWKDIQKNWRELREKNRLIKEDRKRRTAFPGHFGREFYQIIFKNYRANFRGYVLFLIAESVEFALALLIFSTVEYFGGAKSIGANYIEMTLMSTLNAFLPVFAFLFLMLIAMILNSYIRTRMDVYGIYLALGARRSTLGRIIAFDFGTCVLFSLLVGFGIAAAVIFVKDLPLTPVVLIEGLGLTLLVLLVAVLINYHLFEYQDIMRLNQEEANEKFSEKRWVLNTLFIVGAVDVIWEWRSFCNANHIISVWSFAVFLFYAYCLFYAVFAMRVRRFMKAGKEENLLKILPWRSRFHTNLRTFFLLFALFSLSFSFFLPRMTGYRMISDIDELMPYDYVAQIHEEDVADLAEIEAEGADVKVYPMLRATTPLGVDMSWLLEDPTKVFWPQGQHVAVSETTYRSMEKARGLTPKELNLSSDGEKVHIVFQQEFSAENHPLDWYSSSGNWFRLGQPIWYDPNLRDIVYPDHEVTRERAILTGSVQGGTQENIIVLNDEYFDKIYSGPDRTGYYLNQAMPDSTSTESKEGPSRLVLIDTRESEAAVRTTEAVLDRIAERHPEDLQFDESVTTYYSKENVIHDNEANRTLTSNFYLIFAGGFILAAIFVFCTRYALSAGEQAKKEELLLTLGMDEKERKKLFRNEVRSLQYGSLILALLVSVAFVWAYLTTREPRAEEIASFMKMMLLFDGISIGSYVLFTEIFYHLFGRYNR